MERRPEEPEKPSERFEDMAFFLTDRHVSTIKGLPYKQLPCRFVDNRNDKLMAAFLKY